MPIVPLFPLPMVAFPGESVALHIFEPRYKEMIGLCIDERRPFAIVSVDDGRLGRVATLEAIVEVTKRYEDGRLDIRCEGIARVEILRVISKKAYYEAEIIPFDDTPAADDDALQIQQIVTPLYRELMEMASREAGHEPPPEPDSSFGFAQYVGLDLSQKQQLLELRSETARLNLIKNHLEEVVPRIRVYQMVKTRIITNGDFRYFPPLDLNL
jgi:ATP-dependent Lon protease